MLYPNAPHFYHDDNWAPGVAFCGDSALARLRAGRQYEGDVSRTLAFFTGTFGDAMIKILLDFARVRARPAEHRHVILADLASGRSVVEMSNLPAYPIS